MGDSGYWYQFGTGIGEEELNRLEAQGAAIAPATRMILAEVPAPLEPPSKPGTCGRRCLRRRVPA
jgi:hypothetical protein